MSFGSSNKRTPTQQPIFPTRTQIIEAYFHYTGTIPDESTIQAHLGNPGGIDAVIKLLILTVGTPGEGDIHEQPVNELPTGGIVVSPIQIATNISPIGMSYWRRINNHSGQDRLKVALAKDNRITIYLIDKESLKVMDYWSLDINTTGEDIYFSALDADTLYVRNDKALMKINTVTGYKEVVMTPPDGLNLWQCHTSNDGLVHSATLKERVNDVYTIVGWGVQSPDGFRRFDLMGKPDECQIDKSGRYLCIKEDDDLRVVDLNTKDHDYFITIRDDEGAPGHSDCGYGWIIGEDNKDPNAGALVGWDLNNLQAGKSLFYSTGTWNMGYVSFSNAADVPIESQKCLLSTPHNLISVKLNRKMESKILYEYSYVSKYEDRIKANLCPLGMFAVWTERIDGVMTAKIMRIPSW